MKYLLAFLLLCSSAYAQPDWGTFADGVTIIRKTNTVDTDGAPATPTGENIAVYKDASDVEITAGVSIDDDFDTIVGMHQITIDTTGSGLDAGEYSVVYTAGTADSVSLTGRVIAFFRIGVVPSNLVQVDGTTLDSHDSGAVPADLVEIANAAVSTSTAQLGVNVVNVGGSATPVTNLGIVFNTDFATNYDTTLDRWNVDVEALGGSTTSLADLKDFADTGYDPASHIVVEVGLTNSIGNGAITNDSFVADALTADKFHTDVWVENWSSATRILTAATNITSTGGTTVPQTGDVYAQTNSGVFGLAIIEAQTDDIGVAGAGLTAIDLPDQTMNITGSITGNLSGFVGSVTGLTAATVHSDLTAIKGYVDDIGVAGAGLTAIPYNAAWDTEIEDAVWDTVLADHLDAGSTGNALNAAGSAGDPWSTALPGAYGAGTAGKIIGDNINATISSRASQTSLDTVDDYVDSEVNAILTDTNELQTDWANGGRLEVMIDDIEGKTVNLPADPADASDIASSFSTVNATLSTITGHVDGIPADVWGHGTKILTAGTNIVLAKGTGITGFNDIAAADVWSVGTRRLTDGTNIVLAKGVGVTGFNDITAVGVWDVLTSSIGTVNSIGLQLETNVDAKISEVEGGSGGGGEIDSGTFTGDQSGTTIVLGNNGQDDLTGCVLVIYHVSDVEQFSVREVLSGSREEAFLNISVAVHNTDTWTLYPGNSSKAITIEKILQDVNSR